MHNSVVVAVAHRPTLLRSLNAIYCILIKRPLEAEKYIVHLSCKNAKGIVIFLWGAIQGSVSGMQDWEEGKTGIEPPTPQPQQPPCEEQCVTLGRNSGKITY